MLCRRTVLIVSSKAMAEIKNCHVACDVVKNDNVHKHTMVHRSITFEIRELMYINIYSCFYICMGCASSVPGSKSLKKERSDRRLAVCNSCSPIGKDDIVLIVRSARVLETSDSGTICVQFTNKEGMSFEWIQASEVCAVLCAAG